MLRGLPLVALLSSPAWAASLLGSADGTHGLHLLAQASAQAPGDPRGPLRAELEQLRDVPSLVPGIVMPSIGLPGSVLAGGLFFTLLPVIGGSPVALIYVVGLATVALAALAVAVVGTVLLIRALVARTGRADRTREVEEELERLDQQLGPERPAAPGPPPEPYPPGVWLPTPAPALAVARF